MKKIYICSPYRGDIETNITNARKYCRDIIMQDSDNIPICPHIYFTQFLDDDNECERILALETNLSLLLNCDEVYAYINNGISEGMKKEIDFAIKSNIPVKYIK